MPFCPCVIAPTFNNAGTLRAVLDGLREHAAAMPVVVVDDGSNDGTAEVLAAWGERGGGRFVMRHTANRGKAEALRTGFAHAVAAGFSHAATIDTDGQLDPNDLPRLLAAAETHRDALVLGERDAAASGMPLRSRLGRWASNAMVRLHSGARVTDSQCGYRVYPLAAVAALRVGGGRYEYETAWLVRAAWAGVPILGVPVRCVYSIEAVPDASSLPERRSSASACKESIDASYATERVTHYRVLRDTGRAIWLHFWLLHRSLVPWPVRRLHPVEVTPTSVGTGTLAARFWRWISPARAWASVKRDPAGRRRFAAAIGVGAFIGNTPLFGLHTPLCLLFARILRLPPVPVVAGAHVTTPPLGPVLIALALAVGHVVLRGRPPAWSSYDPAEQGWWELVTHTLAEWVVGSVIVGAGCGAVLYAVTRSVLILIAEKTGEKPTSKTKDGREERGDAETRRKVG